MIDYSALPSKVRGRYLAKPTEFGPPLLILKRDFFNFVGLSNILDGEL